VLVEPNPEELVQRLTTIVAALALVAANSAAAEPASLKDRLVGTWHFVVAEIIAPDGTRSFPFGPNPHGILMFGADGSFANIHIAGEVPKIATGERLGGTPEEYAAIMRNSIALFGTYTVDEANKRVTFNIASSTFPNWQGVSQTRVIDTLTDDEFRNTNPDIGGGRGAATNLYRRKK
jgi:Lipocalin-like domain